MMRNFWEMTKTFEKMNFKTALQAQRSNPLGGCNVGLSFLIFRASQSFLI
jgi:hypothetical protein